jgi:hypothetical protein
MKLIKDFGVRALEATLIVGGAVAAGLYLVIATPQKELGFGFLSTAGAGVVGYYFGQRHNTTTTDETILKPPATPPDTPK